MHSLIYVSYLRRLRPGRSAGSWCSVSCESGTGTRLEHRSAHSRNPQVSRSIDLCACIASPSFAETRCMPNNCGERLEEALKMANPGGGIEMGNANVNAEDDHRREMGLNELEIYEQMELMADEPNDTQEIRKRKKYARVAFTLWQGKLKDFQEREDRLKAAVSSARNEVYQLMSLYSVFAGVVFGAVATSSRLECQHLWSPVGLCVFIYGMMIVITSMKFQTIDALEEVMLVNRSSRREVARWIIHLKLVGYMRFDFENHCRGIENVRVWPAWYKRLYSRTPLLILLLTIFTIELIGSFIHILCKTKI